MKQNSFFLISTAFLASVIIFFSCKNSPSDDQYKVISLAGSDSAMQVKLDGIAALDIVMNLETPFGFTDHEGRQIWCRLITPPVGICGTDTAATSRLKKYPLVIVLHGSGAVGTDNLKQMGVLAKMWAFSPIRCKYPAYVIVPQFPQRSSNYVTDQVRGVLTSQPQPYLNTLLALVDSMNRKPEIESRKSIANVFILWVFLWAGLQH